MAARRQWKASFLAALRETGNVRSSCEAAGIARTTAYLNRNNSPSFARQWDEAVEDGLDLMEEEARRRAMESSDFLMALFLKSHRPKVYADRQQIEMQLTADVKYRQDLDTAYADGDGPTAEE